MSIETAKEQVAVARLLAGRCKDCGGVPDDECPLCGATVCQVCAEREGSFCCADSGAF
jgi:hypothetical protein